MKLENLERSGYYWYSTSHNLPFFVLTCLGRRLFFGLFLLLSAGPKVWQVQSSSSTASTPIWSDQIPVLLGRTPSKNIPKWLSVWNLAWNLSIKSQNCGNIEWISLDFYGSYIFLFFFMFYPQAPGHPRPPASQAWNAARPRRLWPWRRWSWRGSKVRIPPGTVELGEKKGSS